MEKISKINQLLEFVRDNPNATNEEVMEAVGISHGTLKEYKRRLIKRGSMEINEDKSYKVLTERPKGPFKKGILMEMVESYMEDFREAERINDKIKIGELILKILTKL